VKNVGSATWTSTAGYRLGAVDDTDPFRADNRVVLDPADTIATGGTRVFSFDLLAPSTAGTYPTDWRMVHEGIRWFGATALRDITVTCPVNDFDLASVTILGSPDVRGFAITSQITSVEFSPGNLHVDHTMRGQWPGVVIAPDGTLQEATIWVFFKINGAWYGTGGERLRPNQTDKGLTKPSDIGPGWLYDPNRWGVMTNYVPQVGELVGFMVVAGSTRSDNNVIVQERTGVVLYPFPPDGQTTAFPPFTWTE
jgi:hypothetical protein